jgi:DNA repair exonuclease SbcCD ATPase subunit
MTIQELKAEIEKTEKRIASPILVDSAKNAFKKKLEGYKAELAKLEGDSKKVEKKTEEKVDKSETVVKKDVTTIEELKAEIEKTEKRIASPILVDSAKNAFKKKLEGYKAELAKLEGGAKKTEKKAEKAVEKKVEKVEASVKRDVNEVKVDIERLEKKIKNPIIDDNAKKALREKLQKAKSELESLSGKTKATAKKEVKKVAEKVEAVAKTVKKEVVKKASKKTTTSVAKKESSPTVMVNGKKLSVEDCKEVLQEWNKRRKKAKSSSKKSRSRSTSTKVSANVVHAIETAIESVPAIEISENPTREINKFKRLVQSGEEFLKAFKAVLGDEYNTIDIKKEFDDVDKLIKSLIKKYK